MSQADINQTADEFEAQLLAQRRENEVLPCSIHMLQFLLLCVSGRALVTACGAWWVLVLQGICNCECVRTQISRATRQACAETSVDACQAGSKGTCGALLHRKLRGNDACSE